MVTESASSCGADWLDDVGTREAPVVTEPSVILLLLMCVGSVVLDFLFKRDVRMDDGDGCMMSESSSSSTLIASGDDDDDDESSDISDGLAAAGYLLRDEPTSESSAMPPSSTTAYALQREVGAREVDATSVLLCEAAGADAQFGSACQRSFTLPSLQATGHTLHRYERL